MIENFNSIHPFPARMAPSIVWDYVSSKKKSIKILDPMVGSGTTTTIARLSGHEAYGLDTDPLAVLISTAWSLDFDYDEVLKRAHEVLIKAKSTAKSMTSNNAFPKASDANTRDFIKYWFDVYSRKELTALSFHIGKVRNHNVRILLWTAFSRMIITKKVGVSLAMDVSHSRPHKVYEKAPIRPFKLFIRSIKAVLKRSPFFDRKGTSPEVIIKKGDSRKLPFANNYFDLIITSPPYLNAIDYFRSSKLSLVWMGKSTDQIQKLRKENIGSEIKGIMALEKHQKKARQRMGKILDLPNREQGFANRYINDMDRVMAEISRVSKKDSRIVLVVGDSYLKNVYISNSSAIISLAEHHGLSLVRKFKRALPPNKRYLPCPTNNSSGKELMNRMRHEVIIELKKAS